MEEKDIKVNAKKDGEYLEIEVEGEGLLSEDLAVSLARRIAVLVKAGENIDVNIVEGSDKAVAVYKLSSDVEPEYAKNIVKRYIENSQLKEYIKEPEIIDSEYNNMMQYGALVRDEWIDAEWFEETSKIIGDEIERALTDDAYLPEGLSLEEKLGSDFTVMEITGLKDSVRRSLEQEMIRWFMEPVVVSGKELKRMLEEDGDNLIKSPIFAGLDRAVVLGIRKKMNKDEIKDDGVYLVGKRPEVGRALLISAVLRGLGEKKDIKDLVEQFLIYGPFGIVNGIRFLIEKGKEWMKAGSEFVSKMLERMKRRGVDIPTSLNISVQRHPLVLFSQLASVIGKEKALKIKNSNSFDEMMEVAKGIVPLSDIKQGGSKPRMGM
ncbi:MAG: hypothetical protein QXX95_02985 [Nitrososphaerales archaeon]